MAASILNTGWSESAWEYFTFNMPEEWDDLMTPQPEISAPEVDSSPDPMIEGIKKVERFACQVPGCGKDYSKSTGLRAHNKAKHEIVQKKFACPRLGCQSRFAENYELTRHLKKTHGLAPSSKKSMVFICPVKGCPARYTRDSSLQRHVQKKHLNE